VRLEQEVAERTRRTETLFASYQEEAEISGALLKLAEATSSFKDLDSVLEAVVRTTPQLLGLTRCGLFLFDPADGALIPSKAWGLPEELWPAFQGLRGAARIPAVVEAIEKQEPVVIEDAAQGAHIPPQVATALNICSMLIMPLVSGGRLMGTMAVDTPGMRHTFTPKQIALARGIAAHAAVAIENARLYREAREVAERLRLLGQAVSSLGEVIVVTDLEGRIIFVNEAIKTVFGYALPDALGKYAQFLWAPSTPRGQKRLVQEATAGGGWQGEVRGLRADGSEFPVALITGPVRDASGRAVALVGVVRDLTPEKALQAKLLQAEKLAALGGMAEGIAHTFNNLLAVILGRAQLLLRQTKDTALQDQLRVIEQVALEGAQTVRRVQEFTRMKRAWPFESVSLNHVVEEAVEATRGRWQDEAQARGIRYEVLVETTPLPPVTGDPSELCEALTNMVSNALDAMPQGGRVRLKTEVKGGHVYAVVTDTGGGMTEEVRQRVFNPFFTTRPELRSGLGLSVVYGIIARHGGEIEVQSQVGQGSTFTIRLPVKVMNEE
jgi:PAS domain S-box-containing protein